MREMTDPLFSTLSLAIRLLVALLLGFQFCLVVWLNMSSPGLAWLVWVTVAILLCAMLLSVFFAPAVRLGAISSGGVLLAMLKALLGVSLLLLVLILQVFVFPLVALLVPLAVGLIAAFTLGGGNRALSVGVAATNWLGVGVALIMLASAQSNEPGNDLGGLVFNLIVAGVVLGFGLAIVGSLLGRLFYLWAFS